MKKKKQKQNKIKRAEPPKAKRGAAAKKAAARRRTFGISEKIVGVVQGSGKGFAFLIPENGGGDLFIAARNLGGALHGDTVEAVKIGNRRGNGECEVVRIIKRGSHEIVGVFDGKCVVSRDRGFGSVRVDLKKGMEASVGDTVVAALEYGSALKCRITEVLGRSGETQADVMGVIRDRKSVV